MVEVLGAVGEALRAGLDPEVMTDFLCSCHTLKELQRAWWLSVTKSTSVCRAIPFQLSTSGSASSSSSSPSWSRPTGFNSRIPQPTFYRRGHVVVSKFEQLKLGGGEKCAAGSKSKIPLLVPTGPSTVGKKSRCATTPSPRVRRQTSSSRTPETGGKVGGRRETRGSSERTGSSSLSSRRSSHSSSMWCRVSSDDQSSPKEEKEGSYEDRLVYAELLIRLGGSDGRLGPSPNAARSFPAWKRVIRDYAANALGLVEADICRTAQRLRVLIPFVEQLNGMLSEDMMLLEEVKRVQASIGTMAAALHNITVRPPLWRTCVEHRNASHKDTPFRTGSDISSDEVFEEGSDKENDCPRPRP